VRSIELGARYDIPRTAVGWLIIADCIEARFSYLRRKKLGGSVGFGFDWEIEKKHSGDIAMVWKALAKNVAMRLIETEEPIRMLNSEIVQATAGPRLGIRLEGD